MKTCAAFLTVLVLSSQALAGAWTQEPGRYYVRQTVSFYRSTSYYDSTGTTVSGDWYDSRTSYKNTQFLFIGEYGWRHGTTLTTELAYRRLKADRPAGVWNERVSGIGDWKLGLKQRLYNGPVIVSVLGQIEIPTGYDRESALIYYLGEGETNFEGRLLVGGGFGLASLPGWYGAEIGYRLRGGPLDNDLTYSAAVGMRTIRRLWLRAGVSGGESQGDTNSMPKGASWTSFGVATTIVLTRSLNAEISYSGELRGKNTNKGSAIEVGVELRR
jgi:hypothetical protein